MSIEQTTLVYGGSLDALTYAFRKGYPLVYTLPAPPHQFKNGGVDRQRWFSLHFLLGVAGLLPLSSTTSTVRLYDNMLTATTGHAKVFKINFEELHIVDSAGLLGLPSPTEKTGDKYEVLDWVSVRSGMVHPHSLIENPSDFMNYIHFYPSKRIDGNHDKKDACVISYLTEEQLLNFEFSEVVTKIKLGEQMEEKGIKGAGNGVGKNLPIKLESSHRQCFPLGKKLYGPVPHVEFVLERQPFTIHSDCVYASSLAEYLL